MVVLLRPIGIGVTRHVKQSRAKAGRGASSAARPAAVRRALLSANGTVTPDTSALQSTTGVDATGVDASGGMDGTVTVGAGVTDAVTGAVTIGATTAAALGADAAQHPAAPAPYPVCHR